MTVYDCVVYYYIFFFCSHKLYNYVFINNFKSVVRIIDACQQNNSILDFKLSNSIILSPRVIRFFLYPDLLFRLHAERTDKRRFFQNETKLSFLINTYFFFCQSELRVSDWVYEKRAALKKKKKTCLVLSHAGVFRRSRYLRPRFGGQPSVSRGVSRGRCRISSRLNAIQRLPCNLRLRRRHQEVD